MRQKKSLLLGTMICLTTFTIFSCGGRRQSTDTSNSQDSLSIVEDFGWYEDVFPSSRDSSCIIPNYVYSTDWMQRYIQYIKKNFNGEDGLWTMDGEEFFDCRYWSIANVNNDTIPEMFLYGGCWAAGSRILTQYNGEVYMSPGGYGGFMFIDGADGLIHCQDSHSDELWGGVYKMEKGLFVEKCSYSRFARQVDTSEVGKYGLKKDSICSWLVNDDGTVGIRGTILYGKVIDAHYEWSSDKGKNELKKTMESLYYSKGKSIYFPKPRYAEDSLLSIDELLKKQI